jgi:hypothetical protein
MLEWMPIIKKAVQDGKESVKFTAKTTEKKFPEQVKNAMEFIAFNGGYSGFLINNYNMTYSSDGNVSVDIKYFQSRQQSIAVEEAVKKQIPLLTTSTMSELEKLIAIHDYIIKNISYDHSYTNRSPFLALKEKKSVCSGFALLAGRFLHHAGIKQFYICGDSHQPGEKKSEKHIWNKVFVNNSWFNVDFTWDSCSREINPYNYFCTTDLQLKKTHQPEKKQVDIPESSQDLFYKKIMNKTLSKSEKSILNYIYPGQILKDPKELSLQIKNPGNYNFSVPLGTDIGKFLKSAIEPLNKIVSGFESSYHNNEVLNVVQVKLIVMGR